ncbi:uncharacterized protein [Asterias amurensis]|uniref:uncharacterized protein n=1 Tax=Asterias amurensis TaxID=7602 RepID=UPI003AB83253
MTLSELDFADIALLSDNIIEAQELLSRVESECEKFGLHLIAKKTEYMVYNIGDHAPLKTFGGSSLKEVDDFKYLGSRMQSTEKALHDMKKIWTSQQPKGLKMRFFHAAIKTILLYGCESWTLTKAMTKSINGCYTRMQRIAQNASWRDHSTNLELYGNIPLLSEKIKERRLRLAGHCLRHPELPAIKAIVWEPTHGRRCPERPTKTMLKTLIEDAGVGKEELFSCMQDRVVWRVRHRARLKDAATRQLGSTE